MKSKSDIRKEILGKRNKMDENTRMEFSSKIKSSLFSMKEFQSAKTVMLFVSFGNEVFTHDMIKDALKTKAVVVPKIVNKKLVPIRISSFSELSPRTLGILEPKSDKAFDKKKIDLVVVPGVAFDRRGFRIGYGKGYYDDFLVGINAKKIAVGFDLQIIGKVPNEKHDIPVDMVVSENGIYTV